MPFPERAAILEKVGPELEAGALAYVTGDRENLETDVSADVLRRIPRHLEAVGKQQRLALVLYTLGGDVNTPWPFVNFVRGYCDELYVLVPFYAHSAGTLVADRIYMTRFGTLSPIDPSVTNEFDPTDPAGDGIPIAVEDVLAYFQLAAEQGGDEAEAFRRLAESVHPLALGNVKRSVEEIWQLAKKLIRLHTPDADEETLTALVRRLTTELYSHSHLITRAEASALGLPVEVPPDALEGAMLPYYEQLTADLRLLEKYEPGDSSAAFERAYIETPTTCDAFVTGDRWETVA
jgi:hypothetical protein